MTKKIEKEEEEVQENSNDQEMVLESENVEESQPQEGPQDNEPQEGTEEDAVNEVEEGTEEDAVKEVEAQEEEGQEWNAIPSQSIQVKFEFYWSKIMADKWNSLPHYQVLLKV